MWAQSGEHFNNNEKKSVSTTLGLTSVISTVSPKKIDLVRTNELENILKSFNVFETKKELDHRICIVRKLNTLVIEWIKDLSIKRNVSKDVSDNMRGTFRTFGSYRLGAHNRDSDIDVLCIAPIYIYRSDFFNSFYGILKKHPDVTKLRAIEKAFVPVIKMDFAGIKIDMIIARLHQSEIFDSLNLMNDDFLKHLDQKSVRSINGWRITEKIIKAVPNIQHFKLTLVAIKLWAKKHRIYSNILGYLGGISWTMLVAKTCQLYPNAAPATLIHKFFFIFSMWTWPLPVFLSQPSNTKLGFRAWYSRIPIEDRSRHYLMPIITPVYPEQNTTFNVNYSSRFIIMEELKAGLQITEEIMLGNASWEKLFESPQFFTKYRHFIILIVSSASSSDHLKWTGLVESKIRFLIRILEFKEEIILAHINPESIEVSELNENVTKWFIGLQFKDMKGLNVHLTRDIQWFVETVNKIAVKNKIYKPTMNVDVRYIRRKELHKYLPASMLKKKKSKISIVSQESRKRASTEPVNKVISNKKSKIME